MKFSFEKEYAALIENENVMEIGNLKNLDNIPTRAGGKLCLGLECLDRDLWDFERAFEQIKKLGVHKARLQSGWQKTESVKGVYDFSWLDEVVNKLSEAGIEPFLSLSYGNKLYCAEPEKYPNIENGGVGHIPVVTQEERSGWTNYVKATVEHFKDRITHYEIWNEPDCGTFCCVDMPWTEAYMELIKITAPLIRKLQPTAKIISCTALFSGIKHLFNRGIGEYVDIHSFHGYKFYPEISSGDGKANRISYLEKKYPDLKIWRGESGCPSYNDPISHGALSNIKASEIKQAKFLLRHLVCDLENDAIDLTSYFHAYDFEHFTRKLRYYYGLIRHEDVSRKPAYNCFQVMTHLFDGKVKSNKEHSLAAIYQRNYKISDEQIVNMRFLTFEKDEKLFYAYYLPAPIDDESVVYTVFLTLPYVEGQGEDYVIIDPVTRKIYPVSDAGWFLAPVTDYPMFVVRRDMIADIADIYRELPQEKAEEIISQITEE